MSNLITPASGHHRPELTFITYPFAVTGADTAVRTLALAPDRQLWAGTGDGLYRLQAEHSVEVPEAATLKNFLVRELLFTRDST
ncbi:MAG: hypothetical protein ACK4UT_01020, partial [Moraxellaceae bacterium]